MWRRRRRYVYTDDGAKLSRGFGDSFARQDNGVGHCFPDDNLAPSGDTDVDVTLAEYHIDIDSDSGPPGSYNFSIENTGPNEGHVFMIVQTDLAPDALPTTSTGQFAPNSDAVILANTPGINPNGTDAFSFDLEAGKYVFICNNSDAEGQGHYGLGMHVGFTVE